MLKIDLQFGEDQSNNLIFSEEQKKIIFESAERLKELINGEEFKTQVLNHTFKGAKRFYKTNKTNQKVYEALLSGNDNFINEESDDTNTLGDNDIDIWVIPYKAYKKRKPRIKIVGKTYPTTYKTWINLFNLEYRIKKYGNTPIILSSLIAENLIHEYCHNLGFGHTKKGVSSKKNLKSVPYGVGRIIRKLLQKSVSEEENSFLKIFNVEEIQSCSFLLEEEE